MKHINRNTVFIALLLIFLSHSKLNAQAGATAPYNFHNQLACKVTLDWDVRPLSSCTAAICDFGTGVVLAASGGNYGISQFGTGSACSTLNDQGCVLTITITSIGTTPTTYTTASNITTN